MAALIRCVTDLKVWQLAMELAVLCYRLADSLPDRDQMGMALQIRRAAHSIPCNIAEGFGRKSSAEYARFLQIALGSGRELATLLELAVRIGRVTPEAAAPALDYCDQVCRMLNVLSRKIRQRSKP